MPTRRRSPSTRTVPAKAATRTFALTDGGEECPHCEQTYVYEAEVRCTRCDAPVCPFCVSLSRKAALCPDCAAGRR